MKVNKVYTQGSVVKSLVFGLCILMGLQSALFVPRDKHGPMQALVNGLIVYKGV